MTLYLNITCIIIFVILIVVHLVLSKKAEDNYKIINEWDKIKEYGKKINEKTKNKKN